GGFRNPSRRSFYTRLSDLLELFRGIIRVLLHAVVHPAGHFALAKKAFTCVETLLISLNPIRMNCELIEKAIRVNPVLNERSVFGVSNGQSLLGKCVSPFVHAFVTTKPSSAMQGLCAGRACGCSIHIRRDYLVRGAGNRLLLTRCTEELLEGGGIC